MTQGDNDRWFGEFTVTAVGRWEYTIEAYAERYLSWVDEISKKNVPGARPQQRTARGSGDPQEVGRRLAQGEDLSRMLGIIAPWKLRWLPASSSGAIDLGIGKVMRGMMASYPDRSEGYELAPALTIMVNRPITRFAAWYEFFPRSQGNMPYRHGTLQDSIRRLHDIKAMGFDVVYLPPIHPIGHSFRKGKNNSLVAVPGDVGSPWAIGNEHGGHMALEPQLGTWDDWDQFVATCRELEIEIALDYVMNCSPDHPYVARIRSGSSIVPTDRSSTPKTRRRNTRTSTRSTSGPATAPGCGRKCSRSSCSGSARASPPSASTIRTPNRYRSGNG
jgi:starch synthase (maltosyl-transferring)